MAQRKYRIPKHINQRWTLFGLDTMGWAIWGGFILIGILQAILIPAHSFTAVMWKILILVMLIFLPRTILKDARLSNVYDIFYHRKYAKILTWEAEPDAVIEHIVQTTAKHE